MVEPPGLTVRQAVRFELVLPVRLTMAPVDRAAVRWSAAIGGPEGWVDADLVDFSSGGIGVMSPVFVPRKARVRLKVFGIDGGQGEPLLDAIARVQRVAMTDARPAYLLGTSFEAPDEATVRQINDMIGRLDPTLARARLNEGRA